MPARVTATFLAIIDCINTNDLGHDVTPFDLKSLITDYYITICFVKKLKNRLKNIKKSFLIKDQNSLERKIYFCSRIQFT